MSVNRKIISLFIICFISNELNAQCIQSFPHTEDFETTNGNWSSGGQGSDWAWGAPTKPIISAAANSNNCWIVGGLNGNNYSLGQRSFIQSPCYDFSNLPKPQASFDIFWETENVYDGAVFQSSIDNGISWQNVGRTNEPPNCYKNNWYNNSSINGLSGLAPNGQGWAGTTLPTSGSCQGGGGSGSWLRAEHCLEDLGGLSNVRFRFAFGAGTLCNNFDGVAIDNFTVTENKITSNFEFACTGETLNYSFTNQSTPCPEVFLWNFGDPNSGISNTSTLRNPTHKFSEPGTYQVQLTSSHPCAESATTTRTITTLQNNYILTSPSCYNDQNGIIEIETINGTQPINYTISPSATLSGNQFINLSAGNYYIQTIDSNNCVLTTDVIIFNPNEISWEAPIIKTPQCAGGNNGEIKVNANSDNAGTLTYTNIQSQEQNTTGQFINLVGGQYTIEVSDANNCTSITQVIIPSGPCCESIFIPNAFSPNGDGNNDLWRLASGDGVELLSTKIYSRWGEEIVATQNPFYSWDGKIKGTPADIGTYFYSIKYKCKLVDESFELSGEFVLLR